MRKFFIIIIIKNWRRYVLKNKIVDVVSKATKLKPGFLMENTSEQLWDSLTHFEIILLLEETFDVRLDSNYIAAMRSVDAIVEVLQRIPGGKK